MSNITFQYMAGLTQEQVGDIQTILDSLNKQFVSEAELSDYVKQELIKAGYSKQGASRVLGDITFEL